MPSDESFVGVFCLVSLGEILSTEAAESGNVKPVEAIFCRFGNIVTSISFVISSSSCNAMLSLGFLTSKVRKLYFLCAPRGI